MSHQTKAIMTVLGKDRTGIVFAIAQLLAEENINIVNITQQLMDSFFTMMLRVDFEGAKCSFSELQQKLKVCGERIGVQIHLQDEQLFDAMFHV